MLADPETATVAVAWEAFHNLADRWKLDAETRAQLLGVSPQTLSGWERDQHNPPLSGDNGEKIERISHLINIYDDLAALFGEGEFADTWIHQKNHHFGDSAPLEHLRRGRMIDIIDVRRYLDLARQGW